MATQDTGWVTLLDAATGTGNELECSGATQVGIEYEIPTGVSAGVVVLEHSAVPGYAGTWAQLDSEDVSGGFAAAPSKQFFTFPGPLGVIRPRISTTFSGGAGPKVTVRAKRMFGQ